MTQHLRDDPPCIIGKYCVRHDFVHGAEAEELREKLERFADTDETGEANWARKVLDDTDARDSLAYEEFRQRIDNDDLDPWGLPTSREALDAYRTALERIRDLRKDIDGGYSPGVDGDKVCNMCYQTGECHDECPGGIAEEVLRRPTPEGPPIVTKEVPKLGDCPRCAHLRAMLPPDSIMACPVCGTSKAGNPPIPTPEGTAADKETP